MGGLQRGSTSAPRYVLKSGTQEDRWLPAPDGPEVLGVAAQPLMASVNDRQVFGDRFDQLLVREAMHGNGATVMEDGPITV